MVNILGASSLPVNAPSTDRLEPFFKSSRVLLPWLRGSFGTDSSFTNSPMSLKNWEKYLSSVLVALRPCFPNNSLFIP